MMKTLKTQVRKYETLDRPILTLAVALLFVSALIFIGIFAATAYAIPVLSYVATVGILISLLGAVSIIAVVAIAEDGPLK